MNMQKKVRLIAISAVAVLLVAGGALGLFKNPSRADTTSETFNLADTTITWDTPLEDTMGGVVHYGTTDQYGQTKAETITTKAKSHTVILTDLNPETEYHYKIVLADPAKESDDQTFTTPNCSSGEGCGGDGDGDESDWDGVSYSNGGICNNFSDGNNLCFTGKIKEQMYTFDVPSGRYYGEVCSCGANGLLNSCQQWPDLYSAGLIMPELQTTMSDWGMCNIEQGVN